MAAITLTYAATYALANKKITAAYTNGTNVWVGTDDGEIHKFTQSTGAYVSKVAQVNGHITAFIVSGTQLIVAIDTGEIIQYVLSSAAYGNIPLTLTGEYATALSLNSTNLVIVTNKGNTYNYTVS